MEFCFSTNPAQVAARQLGVLLENYQKVPVLLLFSAGSAFSFLSLLEVKKFPKELTIGMLDERYDSSGYGNNFNEFSKCNFYHLAKAGGASFLDSKVQEDESFVDFGLRFEQGLATWRKQNPEGVIVVTLGLGHDGHTAGLFPGFESMWGEASLLAVAYEVPEEINTYTKRVSVTSAFLKNEVAAAVAYVIGEGKRKALSSVLAKEGSLETLPGLVWFGMRNIIIVTDIKI
jgi:6-phosphogluconolactonase/glucosamine-6-phosphate isomerase/deaminase